MVCVCFFFFSWAFFFAAMKKKDMGKRKRAAPCDALWPVLVERLRASYPVFAEFESRRRVKGRGGGTQCRKLEKMLRDLLRVSYPAALDAEPSTDTILRLQRERHTFGDSRTTRALLRRFPNLPVHPHYLHTLTTAPGWVDDEEEQVVKQVQDRVHVQRTETITLCLATLRTFLRARGLSSPGGTATLSSALSCRVAARFCFFGRRRADTRGLRVAVLLCTGLPFPQRDLDAVLSEYDHALQEAQGRHTAVLDAAETGRSFVQRAPRLSLAMRVCSLSDFHARLLEEMQTTERREARTFFAAGHVARQTYVFARFVTHCEDFAKRNHLSLESFLQEASTEQICAAAQSFLRALLTRPDRVKNDHGNHHAGRVAHLVQHWLRGCLRPHIRADTAGLTARRLLEGIANSKVPADPTTRRTLTDDEARAMMLSARDPLEELLLTLLQEIGLRSSALSHLRYAHLVQNGTPRTECRVPEKGRKCRAFVTSCNLRAKISKVMNFVPRERQGESDFVFNLADPHRPARNIWDVVHRIAASAGITAVRVHPHMYRHTLVGRLVAAGNSLEVVSKFLGHRDVKTTSSYYYVPTAAELGQTLANPVNVNPTTPMPSPDLQNARLVACRSLVDVLLRHCNLEPVRSQFPEFDDILRQIDGEELEGVPCT